MCTTAATTRPTSGSSAPTRPRPGGGPGLVRFLVILLLVAVPLTFNPGDGPRSLPRYWLVVGGAGLVLLSGARGAFHGWTAPIRRSGLHWPVLALVGWSGVSALASDHRRTAFLGYPGSYEGVLTTAALAVLFFAAVATFRTDQVRRAISVLWFGAGAPVLLYGLAQLVDRVLDLEEAWDRARPPDAPSTIGSTFANPNHLAGFLAVLLPLGVALFLLAGTRRERTAIAAMGGALVLETAATGSRGGWLAALAAVAVLGWMLRARLRPHRSTALVAGGVALGAAVLAVVVLSWWGVTKTDVAGLARAGPGSTIDLRLEVWTSAWRMAEDRPLVGVGPDVFTVVFPDYETDRFVWHYGAFTVANGAHNVLMSSVANLGVPGLVVLLFLLGAAARRVGLAWTHLSGADVVSGATTSAHEATVLLAGVTAGIVAYLAQASFNTHHIALNLWFWALLAFAAVIAVEWSGPPTAAE